MPSVLFWSSFLLGILSHCPFLNGAPSLSQCPNSNLDITGGIYTLSNSYNEGSILRYICPEGFYPSTVKKRECDRGQWVPNPTTKPLTCKKITCPNPNVMQNGDVYPFKQVYQVNDTTTYKCHSDYTFRGSSTRICRHNGKWSGGTPICSRNTDHCPDPGTPPGATREGHIFNIDDKVTYTCAKGLKLIGSKVRVCLDGQDWSGIEPECYADFTYDTPEEVAEAFSSSLKSTVLMNEESDDAGKQIHLEKGGKIDIYIALDASDSIDEKHFNKAKEVIKKLITRISKYQVFPNYEILIFATDVTHIVKMNEYKNKDNRITEAGVLKMLDNYKYDDKGEKTGTNIRKAYEEILKSMSLEKVQHKATFHETQHVVIMFTDGIFNMGGNPRLVVDQIKQTVYSGAKNRDKYLDLYAFGVGSDVEKERIDEWVTKRDGEKFFFTLPDMKEVGETLDKMLDESTSLDLCGLYKDYYDVGIESTMRLTYPWMVKISITHGNGESKCIGSLVTPRFILTAAHCFRFDDDVEKILLTAPSGKGTKLPKVEMYIPHPKYNTQVENKEGISVYYEYDVALIQLKESVQFSPDLRTICIPCTYETNAALQLPDNEATCEKQKEKLLNNDLVKAYFIKHEIINMEHPKQTAHIKQGQQRQDCIEYSANILNKMNITAEQMITDNFFCTGGNVRNFIDDHSCKGDSGGPLFLEQDRLIQVGVISWGLMDVCTGGGETSDTRDFHTNLFSPEVRSFLAKYLGNGDIDFPLHFL